VLFYNLLDVIYYDVLHLRYQTVRNLHWWVSNSIW